MRIGQRTTILCGFSPTDLPAIVLQTGVCFSTLQGGQTEKHPRTCQMSKKISEESVASINFSGLPKLRHRSPRSKGSKPKFYLDIQGCFNCESPDHIARDCLRTRNLGRAAAQRVDYLYEKKSSNAVQVVLYDIFHQLNQEE